VPELAGNAEPTAQQTRVNDYRAANARSDGQHNHVL
jgi:hypothetical protein